MLVRLREDRILVSSIQCMSRTHHVGIIVVALFAIISGLTEVVVGLTGHTFGILSKDLKPNAATAVVGAFYNLGSLSLLTMKKWGAVLGILFISAEILGRIYLVSIGTAPSTGGDQNCYWWVNRLRADSVRVVPVEKTRMSVMTNAASIQFPICCHSENC